jgi:hypothetical protein
MESQHFGEVPKLAVGTEGARRLLGSVAASATEDPFILPNLDGMSLADVIKLELDPEVRKFVIDDALTGETTAGWNSAL